MQVPKSVRTVATLSSLLSSQKLAVNFCISQMEMDRAVKAKDSNLELRQIGCVKKTPGLERILIDQASKSEKKT